jgi:DNA-binding Lrp family transcriptional regulator
MPWSFLTNHAYVLSCLARDPGIRLREIAAQVGITERATHRIVSELIEEGYVSRQRNGRRNTYDVSLDAPLRHPVEKDAEVSRLLDAIAPDHSLPVRARPKRRAQTASQQKGKT